MRTWMGQSSSGTLRNAPGLEFHGGYRGHCLRCPSPGLGAPLNCSHRCSDFLIEVSFIKDRLPCCFKNEIPGLYNILATPWYNIVLPSSLAFLECTQNRYEKRHFHYWLQPKHLSCLSIFFPKSLKFCIQHFVIQSGRHEFQRLSSCGHVCATQNVR